MELYQTPRVAKHLYLSHQLLLQLFEALALGFRTPPKEEDEGAEADGAIDPEGAAAAEGRVHRRKREGERATAYP